jgi:alpha-tubulin suppressor-like RCC1 family protein
MKTSLIYGLAVNVMDVSFIRVKKFIYNFIFLFFLENNTLYSCGENLNNQKGIMTFYHLKIPTKIKFFDNIGIENIFTGKTFSFVKTINS